MILLLRLPNSFNFFIRAPLTWKAPTSGSTTASTPTFSGCLFLRYLSRRILSLFLSANYTRKCNLRPHRPRARATHLVLNIPTGRGAKIKTMSEGQGLAEDFIDLGKRLEINVQCAVTFGEQPLGYAIEPALEGRAHSARLYTGFTP